MFSDLSQPSSVLTNEEKQIGLGQLSPRSVSGPHDGECAVFPHHPPPRLPTEKHIPRTEALKPNSQIDFARQVSQLLFRQGIRSLSTVNGELGKKFEPIMNRNSRHACSRCPPHQRKICSKQIKTSTDRSTTRFEVVPSTAGWTGQETTARTIYFVFVQLLPKHCMQKSFPVGRPPWRQTGRAGVKLHREGRSSVLKTPKCNEDKNKSNGTHNKQITKVMYGNS